MPNKNALDMLPVMPRLKSRWIRFKTIKLVGFSKELECSIFSNFSIGSNYNYFYFCVNITFIFLTACTTMVYPKYPKNGHFF